MPSNSGFSIHLNVMSSVEPFLKTLADLVPSLCYPNPLSISLYYHCLFFCREEPCLVSLCIPIFSFLLPIPKPSDWFLRDLELMLTEKGESGEWGNIFFGESSAESLTAQSVAPRPAESGHLGASQASLQPYWIRIFIEQDTQVFLMMIIVWEVL